MIQEPKCFTRGCRWFIGVKKLKKGDESSEVVICAAFKKGIPNDIAYGDNLHLSKREDQSGNYTFEEK